MKKFRIVFFTVFMAAIALSCDRFLDIKSDRRLAVISTADDLQALLDMFNIHNASQSALGEILSDNYYMTLDGWNGLRYEYERNKYIWATENLYYLPSDEWSSPYQAIYYANEVLDNIDKVQADDPHGDLRDIRGQALFVRSFNLLHVATVWAPAFSESDADSRLGIPLRLEADFTKPSTRATLRETYERVVTDLQLAASLLTTTPKHKTRPSKQAAYGALARTYLYMSKFDEAAKYADSALMIQNELLDYNWINGDIPFPFERFNEEVIIDYSLADMWGTIHPRHTKIDTTLYRSYDDADLRKTLFFLKNDDGSFTFRGSYYPASGTFFAGITTAELILTKAESLIRTDRSQLGIDALNLLLRHRIDGDQLVPLTSDMSEESALARVLQERRKELVMRGMRWIDIKRLNHLGENIVLERVLGHNRYVLSPNDPRYAFQIPEDIIQRTGMQQNPVE